MRLMTLCLIVAVFGSLYAQSSRDTTVLIYTKNGDGYVHDNISASVEALKRICDKNDIGVTVSDDPAIFTQEQLSRFSAVIFSNTNNEGFDTNAQRIAFKEYVQAGGGFMGIHSACASERQWPWFWANIGGLFVRHPKLQPFTIKVIDHAHPSTAFLGDTWEWEDECYLINHLNPDIRVLLAVDLRTIKDDQIGEFPGEMFGNFFPLAWYHTFDGGRQFFTALGHKIEHYQDETFVRHLEGGLLWAIGDNQTLDYSNVNAGEISLIKKAD